MGIASQHFGAGPDRQKRRWRHDSRCRQRRSARLFAGACTYAEGATAMGYTMGIVGAAPRTFRLYASGVRAP
jgi:hypothetical protein